MTGANKFKEHCPDKTMSHQCQLSNGCFLSCAIAVWFSDRLHRIMETSTVEQAAFCRSRPGETSGRFQPINAQRSCVSRPPRVCAHFTGNSSQSRWNDRWIICASDTKVDGCLFLFCTSSITFVPSSSIVYAVGVKKSPYFVVNWKVLCLRSRGHCNNDILLHRKSQGALTQSQ